MPQGIYASLPAGAIAIPSHRGTVTSQIMGKTTLVG